MSKVMPARYAALFAAAMSAPMCSYGAEASSTTLNDGYWPESLNRLDGDNNGEWQILFSPDRSADKRQFGQHPVIEINEETTVYAPRGIEVLALPRSYNHPELSDEVQKFYVQGVGNYAFWAVVISFLAVSR